MSFDFSLKPSVILLNLHSRYGDIVNLKVLDSCRGRTLTLTPLFFRYWSFLRTMAYGELAEKPDLLRPLAFTLAFCIKPTISNL